MWRGGGVQITLNEQNDTQKRNPFISNKNYVIEDFTSMLLKTILRAERSAALGTLGAK